MHLSRGRNFYSGRVLMSAAEFMVTVTSLILNTFEKK